MPRAQYEIPVDLKEAQERFDQWRSSQSGRRAIPESLWAQAAELAGQHGVFRTAQLLRLGYNKLKGRTRAAAPASKPPVAPQPTFVELIASSAAGPCECIIEVEGPRGRMRIEWKGCTAPDLPGMSRVLLEPGA
jgi:hypothetical protein